MNEPQVIPNPAPQKLPSKAEAKRYNLTRKQKAFADTLLADPKKAAITAVQETYDPTTYSAAGAIASENLKKPKVLAYLQGHSTKAELVLIEAMSASKPVLGFDKDANAQVVIERTPDHAIRTKAADSILDRVHGKATQRTEHVGLSTMVIMDLTGKGESPPQEILDQLEATDA